MFEQRHEPLLPRPVFLRRLLRYGCLAGAVIAGALAIGVIGYHQFEGLSWLDSFLNAAMILSGMGPVSELRHDGAKFFAGCYALFSGIVFITVAGILFGPMVHRLLHHFHLEQEARAPRNTPRPPARPTQ